MRTFKLEDLDDWTSVVDYVMALGASHIALEGNLGAGKTTFVQYLLDAMGYEQEVTSPTFSIVNVYAWSDREIYHMDLYRLEEYDDLLNAGIEEYLYSDNLCIVEWPQIAIDCDLLRDYLHISISIEEDGSRIVDVNIIRE